MLTKGKIMRLVFEANLYEAIILSVLIRKLKAHGENVVLSYKELMTIPFVEPLNLDERIELCEGLFGKRVTVYYVHASKMSTNIFEKTYHRKSSGFSFTFVMVFIDSVEILGYKKSVQCLKDSVIHKQ